MLGIEPETSGRVTSALNLAAEPSFQPLLLLFFACFGVNIELPWSLWRMHCPLPSPLESAFVVGVLVLLVAGNVS